MKKIIFCASLILTLSTTTLAQELKNITYNQTEVSNSKISLSDNWVTEIKDNTVTIYNGRINNQTNQDVKKLELALYLLPEGKSVDNGNIEGYLVTSVPLEKIVQNSNLVGVNIRSSIKNIPPSGKYNSVLVLSNNKKQVVTYKKLNGLVETKDGKIAIYREQVQPVEKKPDLNPVTQMELKEDNAIALEKDWQIDIDFKNFLVNILGGDISNNSPHNTEVILDVYLTKDNQANITKSFEGVHIASADISKIEAYKKLVQTSVKTNMKAIPASGTYHILLTVSSKDENGKVAVRNKRVFPNTITF